MHRQVTEKPTPLTHAYLRLQSLAKVRSGWLGPLALSALALFVYTLHLDRPPQSDELYHVLAARAYLANGEFHVAEGVYDRGAPFTLLVAWSFDLFGESLVAARLPSVAAAMLLVVTLFLWTRRVAGELAAWLSALLFLSWPDGIDVAQFTRFYALHGVAFWLSAIGLYRLLTSPPERFGAAAALVIAVALCFSLAVSLMPEATAIGISGLGAWATVAIGLPWLRARSGRARRTAVLAFSFVAAAAVGFLIVSEVGADLLAHYRWNPLWLSDYRNAFWFYHQDLSLNYPALYPFLPFAALIAVACRARPALLCLCIFAVAFVAVSFAAMKHIRYIYFAAPFLFVLFGIALAQLWPLLRTLTLDATERALARFGLQRGGARLAVLVASMLFLLAANAAFVKTAARLADVTIPPMQRAPGWAAAKPILEPLLQEASVVLTTNELSTLYYFGHYDLLVSKSRLSEIDKVSDQREEFSTDWRTGRPVISTAESFALIMDCYPDGLLITEDYRWRSPAQLDDEVANLVLARATPVDLSGIPRLQAYYWERPKDAAAPEACSTLPELARKVPHSDNAGVVAVDGQ